MLDIKIENGEIKFQMEGTLPEIAADASAVLRMIHHQLETSPVPKQADLFRQVITKAVLEGYTWKPVRGNLTTFQMGYPLNGGRNDER